MRPRTGASLAATALLLTLAVPASAGHLDPGPNTTTLDEAHIQVDGNPTCEDLQSEVDDPSVFLTEVKLDPAEDTEDLSLSHDGLTGQLDVDARDTAQGQVFDFDVTGDFLVGFAFVKAGSHGNLVDYTPAGADGELQIHGDTGRGDTGLHGPVNPSSGKFYGLSHISFCLMEARAELTVDKTPDGGTITAGQDASFTITVANSGLATARNTVIDDELPAGLTWAVTSETTSGACTVDTSTTPDTLHCDVGELDPGSSFSVTVSAATTRDNCGDVIDNPAAAANADNAEEATDSGDISVQCGAIQVQKGAKHADTSGATSPDLSATFEIRDSGGEVVETVTTDASTGLACADALALGDYSVDETSAATGYAQDPDVESVAVDNAAACDADTFDGEQVSFDNSPLTNVTVGVDSQVAGGTETTITCTDADGTTYSAAADAESGGGDGSLAVSDLEPQTLSCEIVIDP